MTGIAAAADLLVDDLRRLASGSPGEIGLFVGLIAAPAVAAVLIFQRHRLGIVAVLTWVATVGAWLSVYVTGRLAGGAPEVFTLVAIGVVATWLALLVAAMAPAKIPR